MIFTLFCSSSLPYIYSSIFRRSARNSPTERFFAGAPDGNQVLFWSGTLADRTCPALNVRIASSQGIPFFHVRPPSEAICDIKNFKLSFLNSEPSFFCKNETLDYHGLVSARQNSTRTSLHLGEVQDILQPYVIVLAEEFTDPGNCRLVYICFFGNVMQGLVLFLEETKSLFSTCCIFQTLLPRDLSDVGLSPHSMRHPDGLVYTLEGH